MSAKINSAESIRGLACLAVVFSHLAMSFFPYLHHFDPNEVTDLAWVNATHHSPFAFIYSGDAAVFVFFVLSGYVLSYATLNKPEQFHKKIKMMMVKRYPRLMIPALTSCLIIWLVFKFVHINSHHVGMWLQAFTVQGFSLKQVLYEGTIGAFLFSESDVNWVLWTMTIELMGSFALFFLLYLLHYKKIAFWLGSMIIPCLAYYWRGQGFSFGISSFIIGIYIYLYAKTLTSYVAIPMLMLGLYFAGAHNTSASYQWLYAFWGEHTYDYCNFLAGTLIVYSVLMSPLLSKCLDHPILVWLGKLSFSIYLLHLLMLYLVCIPLFNLFFNMGWSYSASAIFSGLSAIGATLIVANFYSRYVDEFAIKASNALANKVLN
ncbi:MULTISPECIES: acyltransferase family protein [Acinetobacter]|uniref:Acyltransferase n=1 Tax=Acinetobacter wuhouensis TaxID=1879050 RepID=A0A4Q7AI03_9GAMM|nr:MULTISPECIES: acyltransferase [Acinetobacter]RZG47747.1 acyltransferase [Acinetobacter wuhouensis]RZG74236.1 acyltransferase [Acinetobacter wuhouensis]RZG80675.1 acyltransferase [Acinetobacter sp. WCHAc060033]